MTEVKPQKVVNQEIRGEFYQTINKIDATSWDNIFEGKGNFTHNSLKDLERIFNQNAPNVTDQWDFYYYLVKDEKDKIVLSNFLHGGYDKRRHVCFFCHFPTNRNNSQK